MTEPKKYRKKPVTIEAMRLKGEPGETYAITTWLTENGYTWLIGTIVTQPDTLRHEGEEDTEEPPATGIWIAPDNGDFMIRTLEGDMRASDGDWIIRGIKGEFYPCKPDIFEDTYEKVSDDDRT